MSPRLKSAGTSHSKQVKSNVRMALLKPKGLGFNITPVIAAASQFDASHVRPFPVNFTVCVPAGSGEAMLRPRRPVGSPFSPRPYLQEAGYAMSEVTGRFSVSCLPVKSEARPRGVDLYRRNPRRRR